MQGGGGEIKQKKWMSLRCWDGKGKQLARCLDFCDACTCSCSINFLKGTVSRIVWLLMTCLVVLGLNKGRAIFKFFLAAPIIL